MHKVHIDPLKKRLYLTLTGFFVGEEILETSDEIIQAIDSLEGEFDMITDISQCRPTIAVSS